MNNQEVSTAYVGSTEIKQVRLGSQLVLAPNGDTLWYKANALPSLDLRFAESKSLVDATTGQNLVTFTRASGGTYVDSQGVLQTAAANEARFDHDPVTGESLGLLGEEQRTNSIRNNKMVGAVAGTPGTLPTNWLISTATGNLTSREIVGTGTENGISYIDVRFVTSGSFTASIYADSSTGVAASNGQTWTSSFYVKLAAGSLTNATVQLSVVENDSGGGFLTGADSSAFVPTSAALITQRQTQTRTNTNASTAFVWSRVRVTFFGAGDLTLRIGLPQLEQGAFATSVIPTTDAAATRAADVASITGTNFSSWYRQDEGTVFVNAFSPTDSISGLFTHLYTLHDGTGNEAIRTIASASFGATGYNVSIVDNGATQVAQSTVGVKGVFNKLAIGYQTNNTDVSANGMLAATDTVCTMPTVTTLSIGGSHSAANTKLALIKRLTYWPQRLPGSTLQTITQ